MRVKEIDMHDGYLHSDSKIVNYLLTHIPEIAQTRRATDSAIKETDTFKLTRNDTLALLNTFDRNYGRFHDGTLQRLHLDTLYAKISTNLSLAKVDGSFVVSDNELEKIIKMSTLAKKEKGSVSLFINGSKVPDDTIYVYMTTGQTDILFPRIYMNVDGANEFFVEKRIYPKYQYINRFFPNFEGNNVLTMILDSEEDIQSKLLQDSIVIYSDGRLITNITNVSLTRRKLNISNNPDNVTKLIITLENDQFGRNVECIIDSAIKSRNQFSTPTGTRSAVWHIPESSNVDLLHGPISKQACYFYINGIRIPNNKVTQIGRLNFTYTDNDSVDTNPKNCVCFFTDRDLMVQDTLYKIYGDDYYLSNMIGVENISHFALGRYENSFFDKKDENGNMFDYHKVLNNNSELYQKDAINKIYDIIERYRDPDEQTRRLIGLKPSLAKNFLDCFAKEDIHQTIIHSNEAFHTLSFDVDNDRELGYEYIYIVDINGFHVPDTELIIVDHLINEFVKIPGRFFNQGKNELHVIKLKKKKNTTIEYRIFNRNDIVNNGSQLMFNTNFLHTSNEPNDYIILEESRDEPSFLYDVDHVGSKFGWKIKRDVTITNAQNGTMIITFDTLPTNEFIVYCKKFTFKMNYVVESDVRTLSDVTIPIRSMTTHRVPVIANGKYKVYLNGKLLYENLDYYFRTPDNYELITHTVLCIRRHIKKDDLLTIYFTDVKQDIAIIKEGVNYNHYGLIYMNGINYPYSHEYIDLYIDGKYISKNDIEILSDKLIRVPKEYQPFKDVYAETNFRVDTDSFDFFLEDYVISDVDKVIREYFLSSIKMSEQSIEKLWYESLHNDVDSVHKLPNPTNFLITDTIRYDLFVNAYFLWLRSYASKTIIKAHENIDKDIVAYFRLYSNSIADGKKDVVVGANRVAFFEPLVLGSKNYYRNKTEKMRKLLEWGNTQLTSTRKMLEEYTKDLDIANDLYPRDLPRNVSSRTIVNRINKDVCLGGRHLENII